MRGCDGDTSRHWCALFRLYVLRHHGDKLLYQVATPTGNQSEDRRVLEEYLRLDSDLCDLYTQ